MQGSQIGLAKGAVWGEGVAAPRDEKYAARASEQAREKEKGSKRNSE